MARWTINISPIKDNDVDDTKILWTSAPVESMEVALDMCTKLNTYIIDGMGAWIRLYGVEKYMTDK